MTYAIQLVHYKGLRDVTKLWTLQGAFSREFIAGFLYGALYVITLPEYKQNYYFNVYAPWKYIITNYRALEKAFDIPSQFEITDIKDITSNLTEERSKPGQYTVWVKYHWEGQDANQAVTIHSHNLENLQGVITAANAFNVTDMILTKAYKDGVFYDINGLNLPTPR